MCCAAISGPATFYLLRVMLGAAEAGAHWGEGMFELTRLKADCCAGLARRRWLACTRTFDDICWQHVTHVSHVDLIKYGPSNACCAGCFPGMWWTCEQVSRPTAQGHKLIVNQKTLQMSHSDAAACTIERIAHLVRAHNLL
jgi:hypothetical protein